MPEAAKSTMVGTIEHAAAVAKTPFPATVLPDTADDGRSHVAIAVTEQHGLQVKKVEEDESKFPAPWRAKGGRNVADIDSFLAELARRPLGESGTLWGKGTAGTITAIYNDHTKDTPGWRDDTLTVTLKADEDWVAWHQLSGQFMPQEKFGDIIEELRHTIQAPDQADLLEIIDSVRASTSGEFESTIERARGGIKATYKKEVNARAGAVGRELQVPETITLLLRPWDNHPVSYEVQAYFRLNITEGHLRLAVKLFPTRVIIRQAWEEITERVTNAVNKPVYAIS
ncbi:DUF2303 family protein [Mycobacterium sp. CVI_P3]|uniref:DUF2303 family protein n=1 Tax=Mycobacterium pinniadriaticum TaxID=2994102 RepID=A0ABT3SE46_9MYCO|nr:DUF2303 family protein [Mycobacterium pinniadriaticum]MCX2931362.1 DUF2303 family protein [Mycobacterium pinniadriaticum]MCX2937786.1 DUF2303 family protein [Mycobacterium pinniadriaticum]